MVSIMLTPSIPVLRLRKRRRAWKRRDVHGGLRGGPLDQLAPVGRGRVGGHGQALEGVRLEGAGEGAQVVHDGEGLLLLPLWLPAEELEELLLAWEGAEEGAGCCEGGHFPLPWLCVRMDG
jgi:hypothetical protein